MDSPIPIKIVLLGSGNVGKSTCLLTFAGMPPGDVVPTIIDVFDMHKTIDGVNVVLNFWEVSSNEDSNAIRPQAYQDASVVLLFYSVASTQSLEIIRSVLYYELQTHIPHVPVVLVASKIDLREDTQTIDKMTDLSGRGPLTTEDGHNQAQFLHTQQYVEVCGVRNEGVTEMFEAAVRAALAARPQKEPKKSCVVM